MFIKLSFRRRTMFVRYPGLSLYWLGIASILYLATALPVAATELPAAQLQKSDGLQGAVAPSNLQIPLTEGTGEVRLDLLVGSRQPGIAMTLLWSDGSRTESKIKAAPATTSRKVKEKDKTVVENLTLPDAVIELSWPKIKRFVRPNPAIYPDDVKGKLAAGWDKLPAASEHSLSLSLKTDKRGVECWVDGHYAGREDKAARLMEIQLSLSAGAAIIGKVQQLPGVDRGRFLALDMRRMNRPGAMDDVVLTMNKNPALSPEVPLLPGGSANIDLGLARELTDGSWHGDPYLTRSAFDGMPESHIFSVPPAQYVRAWVLCAAVDDPSRDPVLTARLTRFAREGRGDAIADVTVKLPADEKKPPAGVVRVGSASFKQAGQAKLLPLWRVEMVLPVGQIQDLLWGDKNGILGDTCYLDFELLGRTEEAGHKPDRNSVSSVHVFAVTLERTPVEMEIRQAQTGNIFQDGEDTVIPIALRPLEHGRYTLQWAIRDVDGRPVGKGERKLILDKVGQEEIFQLPLTISQHGWYSIDCCLYDENGRLLIEHPAAFALLAADKRRAGYESPYGTWWFGGAHYGTTDPAVAGPLMLRAGLRKTVMSFSKNTEADMAPWKVTSFQIPWMGSVYRNVDISVGVAKYEERVRKHLQAFPHCDSALIFHESYNADIIAPELYGGRPKPTDEAAAKAARQRWDIAVATSKMFREKFPNIKLIFANCNGGSALAAEFFRNKYPKEYIDYLGIEAGGQSFMPEKLTEFGTQAGWVIRETGRKMGYDLPVTASYEWLYRSEHVLGPKRLAEWYVRDALIANAYRFPHISMALLYDAGNNYYNSGWGIAGLCRRYPLLYPKPAYVAYATLTRVLDGAEMIRRVPTGSLTAYALEFKRGQERLYTLWTPRGECANVLRFAGETTVTVEDIYGRSRQLFTKNREISLISGTSVQYVVSAVSLESLTSGARSFPDDRPPVGAFVVDGMVSLTNWQLQDKPDNRLQITESTNLPLRTVGKYTLKEATDLEKGKCLELELIPEGKPADVISEYTVLKLKEPVAIKGRPATLGVWVRGNSGWGRIMWEFEDAEGESWLSSGRSGWGCDILDWPGDISVNFDGWCFLRFPISEESPAKIIGGGGLSAQWVAVKGAGKGNRKVDYPIRITGLAVEMTQNALDLSEMAPVKPVIRLKDLSVY